MLLGWRSVARVHPPKQGNGPKMENLKRSFQSDPMLWVILPASGISKCLALFLHVIRRFVWLMATQRGGPLRRTTISRSEEKGIA